MIGKQKGRFTSFPKHIRWWMVINDLNETTQDEFCVRSIKRSANWGIETFISLVAWRRTRRRRRRKTTMEEEERVCYNPNVFVLVPWFLLLLLYKQLSLALVQRWYFSLQEVDRQDFVHLVASLNNSTRSKTTKMANEPFSLGTKTRTEIKKKEVLFFSFLSLSLSVSLKSMKMMIVLVTLFVKVISTLK